jgi:Pseudomonas phage homing endonuclease
VSERKPVVYLLTCLSSGKRYVGIAKSTAEKRFKRHCAEARQGSRLLIHKAIRKYGRTAFSIRVLATADTWEHAKRLERQLIVEQDTFMPVGYNMTLGGEGTVGYRHRDDARAAMSRGHLGKVMSDESRQRMSEAKKGLLKSLDTRVNMALAQQARVAAMSQEERQQIEDRLAVIRPTGPLSDGHKAKISATTKGRPPTPSATRIPHLRAAMCVADVRAKIVASNRRRTVTQATREKMSRSLRVALADPRVKAKIAASNAARVWSDESRAKLGVVHRGVPKSLEQREKMRIAAIEAHRRRREIAAAAWAAHDWRYKAVVSAAGT